MGKSADAFRTISEVADWLGLETHVLRFWESKFKQIKPIKRAGGRRYYRPNDMLLIGGIKQLLHNDGMTIKGAQKLLRDKGIKHVMGLSAPLDADDRIECQSEPETNAAPAEATPKETPKPALETEPAPAPATSNIGSENNSDMTLLERLRSITTPQSDVMTQQLADIRDRLRTRSNAEKHAGE